MWSKWMKYCQVLTNTWNSGQNFATSRAVPYFKQMKIMQLSNGCKPINFEVDEMPLSKIDSFCI
jgi:hypothetical protein